MTPAEAAARPAETENTHTELLHELERAHKIIRNALLLMSASQVMVWTERNARDGLQGKCVTRADERAAAIQRAGGTIQ